jgi:hypothetical protein
MMSVALIMMSVAQRVMSIAQRKKSVAKGVRFVETEGEMPLAQKAASYSLKRLSHEIFRPVFGVYGCT